MPAYPIEIPLSKSKLTKLLIASAIFLAAGLWILVAQPETGNPIFNAFIVKNTAGALGIVMGLPGIIFFTRKLADKRPGLIIDSMGVTDNSSSLSLGFIPWSDITSVESKIVQVSVASKQKFVAIKLRNPEVYIDSQTSALKRKAMQVGLKHSDSPVNISANGLNIKYDYLLQLLQDNYRANRY